VSVDGLEKTEGDPNVHGHDVQVLHEVTPQEGTGDCARAEDANLSGVGVLGGKTERSGVLVMYFVNTLIQATRVQCLVGWGKRIRIISEKRVDGHGRTEVVEHVLKHEEEGKLRELRLPTGEGHLPCRKSECLAEGVEQPDLDTKCQSHEVQDA
jgi:hypothetical protein